MPTFITIFLLFVAAFLVSVIPGPNLLYIIARGTGQGRSAGLIFSLGIATGGLIQTSAVALGLSGLFLLVPFVDEISKYVGAIYLISLGIRSILSHQKMFVSSSGEKTGLAKIFWQGRLTTLLNPKVAFFYLAFLLHFVDQTRGLVPFQLLILGLVYNLTGLTVEASIAYLSSFLGQWVKKRLGAAKVFRWLTGGTFIGQGARLAFSQKS